MKAVIFALFTQVLLACTMGNVTKNLTNEECGLSTYDSISKREVYKFVEQMPEYPGGTREFVKYFRENFEYTKDCAFQPRFVIEFIIETNGKLVFPRIMGKSAQDLTKVEKDMISVFRKSPPWEPGICKGQPVPVKMFQIVNF